MKSEKAVELVQDSLNPLLLKLEAKTADVGVIGLGYVGLPLALLFGRKGFRVTGFDIDSDKVEKLGRGESYIHHIGGRAISGMMREKRFAPTADFARLREMDAIVICVPTPLDAHREPDLTYIRNTAESISAHLRRGQLVVLESTTYPGTTEEEVLPILEKSGLRCPVAPYAAKGETVEASGSLQPDFFLAWEVTASRSIRST
jgi:UDP-N-acetyl-D-glucosamine dehydrogenase